MALIPPYNTIIREQISNDHRPTAQYLLRAAKAEIDRMTTVPVP